MNKYNCVFLINRNQILACVSAIYRLGQIREGLQAEQKNVRDIERRMYLSIVDNLMQSTNDMLTNLIAYDMNFDSKVFCGNTTIISGDILTCYDKLKELNEQHFQDADREEKIL
jgi:hypothetical protein